MIGWRCEVATLCKRAREKYGHEVAAIHGGGGVQGAEVLAAAPAPAPVMPQKPATPEQVLLTNGVPLRFPRMGQRTRDH